MLSQTFNSSAYAEIPEKRFSFMSLGSTAGWLQSQAKYALFIILLVLLVVTGFKRAWLAMIGCICGLIFVGIFVNSPSTITNLATWLQGKVKLGG